MIDKNINRIIHGDCEDVLIDFPENSLELDSLAKEKNMENF